MFLSGVVITKNVEQTITLCLKSLKEVTDEIVIVDSGSTDRTLEIASYFGCVIIKTDWLGYGNTKNLGNKAASFPYILSLDADEELTPALISEILTIKSDLKYLYSFKRLNNFCGKWIRYGSWYPDVKIRIFPKEILWNNSYSHEQLIISKNKEIILMENYLKHYAYQNLNQFKEKTILYSKLGAQQKSNQSYLKLSLKLFFSPLIGFLKSYFLKFGLLDGYDGFLIGYVNSKGTFLKYFWALKNRLNRK